MASAPVARRRAPAFAAAAILLAVAGTATAAVLVDGYDSQEVPRLETAVWVTRDNGQYARVNTDLAQIDTVRAVADPVGVLQSGARSLVLTQGLSQAWSVDPAFPRDLVAAGESSGSAGAVSIPTPAGTRAVATAGDFIAYLTTTGDVYLGTFPSPGAVETGAWRVDPFAGLEVPDGEDPPRYVADAVAVDGSGRVAVYSDAETAVRVFDAARGVFVGDAQVLDQAAGTGSDVALALVGGTWVLHSKSSGLVWIEGAAAPVDTGLGGDALLQGNASGSGPAYLADASGIVAIDLRSGTAERVVEATGTPAVPLVLGDTAYGAWITPTGATLWSSQAGTSELTVPVGALDDVLSISPVFRSNGQRAVLTETAAGLLWTLDGTLIPTEDWDPLDEEEELEGTVVVEDLLEQEPPVAVDDAFGVRSGAVVSLPLLLNDHDPNKKDILTIDPAVLSQPNDAGFGSVSLAGDNQQAVIRVNATEGSTTFTYGISDGNATSAPATVTLTVFPDDINTAPAWCPVIECTQVWPTPQIAPGGFVTVPILQGWVDPEGDIFALTDAVADDVTAPVTVVPTADGMVAIRHLDPNGGEGVITLTVTVTDAWGASTQMPLEVRVTASPALTLRPVALTGVANQVRQFPISDFVGGGSGAYRLVDAVPSPGSGDLSVTPVISQGTVQLLAPRAGDYLATFTVEDVGTLAQQTATVRLTISETSQGIALPPLVAFVRAHEDATLDVLATAQNTTGRVLLVSQVTSSTPELSVGVVDQTYVRVSGTTADGEPGRIGVAEVVISDGAGNTAVTQLTAFLLPAMQGVNPIAAPDSVVVRAGAQVDIPVLKNDVSPRGQRLQLMAEVEGSEADDELAFGSGTVVRYLAPSVPGVYTLRYTTYLEANPQRYDTGTITVTVLAPGSNRAPEPVELTGRVLAGQVVGIPFNPLGVDPDGDDVFLVDVAQPDAGRGVAWLGASGKTVFYRAPAAGVPGGQIAFDYVVADASGAQATAQVRVGVISADTADVAPVTFSDYVRAQAGTDFPLTVMPLRNDRDPLRGTLNLIGLRPNAHEGTSEYDRLAALIDTEGTSFEEGIVSLRAGAIPGIHSYVYTVEAESTRSTSEGLIVVAVSEDSSPDLLSVSDTTLTARTRADLPAGVDVVTGRVQWITGDPSTLRLDVWGDAAKDFTVSDWSIRGIAPTERTIVPFSLSGIDHAGNEVVTYGFLRIPAFDDMRVQLTQGIEPIRVGEEESATFDVAQLLDVSAFDTLEVRNEGAFAVQRANSQCVPESAGKATYTAGREAPWTDTCSLAVRLEGQSVWSVVPVPIVVIPKDPQAILNPLSRTVAPGQSETINLVDTMITWEGNRVGNVNDLNLVAHYTGTSFDVTQQGDQVTFLPHANAKPGTRETATVTSAAYGGLSATIALVVGTAAPDAPRGATFSHQCDVSRGGTCTIPVVGLSGEYDPFLGIPGAGLTLTRVGTSGTVTCPIATVTQASSTQVVATWPAGPRPAGGECIVDFTVKDGQDRTGPGQVTIDVLGYPQPPSSVTTRSFTGTSVTLRVNLGPAAQAHPALTGVAIYEGGSQVAADCAPAGTGNYDCVINGLVNGAPHTYTARAVNSVGESLDTTALTTWAYEHPTITSVTAVPEYDPTLVGTSQGKVVVTVVSSPDTAAFRVENAGTHDRDDATTIFSVTLDVGPKTLRVFPISDFQPPIGSGNEGAVATASVTVVGNPFFTGTPTVTTTPDSVTVSGLAFSANYAPSQDVVYLAWTGGTPVCSMGGAGNVVISGGAGVVTSTTSTITGLTANTRYTAGACGATDFGFAQSATGEGLTFLDPGAPAGGPFLYTINTSPSLVPGQTHQFDYTLQSGPTVTSPSPDYVVRYFHDGSDVGEESFHYTLGSIPNVIVKLCAVLDPTTCSASSAPISPATAPTGMRVTFPAVCPAGPDTGLVHILGAGALNATVTYLEPTNEYRVVWSGLYSDLDDLTFPTGCLIEPEPEPEGP